MNCSDIAKDLIAAVCGKQALAGTGARVIFINFEDIDRELSVVTNNVITEIVLKNGKKAYAFTSLEDSTVGDFALNKGTWFNTWNHNLPLNIFTKSEASKEFMNLGAGARVVAIVENKEIGTALSGGVVKTGEVKYEVYGWDSGLELLEATGSTAIADGVVFNPKFGTGEKSKENSIPRSFFNTDLTTTEAALAALLAA